MRNLWTCQSVASTSFSEYETGSSNSQPVSSHGTSPATTPGATTRKTKLPTAAFTVPTCPY